MNTPLRKLRAILGFGFIAALLIAMATHPNQNQGSGEPKLAESEQQYCAIKDQLDRDVTANARAHDSHNALQLEEWEKVDKELYQKANVAIHQFFDTHNTLDNWAAKLYPGVSIINNEMVKIEFETTCGYLSLLTVVSRNDTDIISFLRSAKEGSHVLVSGPIRRVGHSDQVGFYDNPDWLEFWGSGPAYITFLVSSIVAVNDDGSLGIEARSNYPANPAFTRALDVAAADAVSSGQSRFNKYRLDLMEQASRYLR